MAEGSDRITEQTFPTPDVVKTTVDPADWDEFAKWRPVIANGASRALDRLDERLARASTTADRLAAFEDTYRYLAEWRYRMTADGTMTRPGTNAETIRTPIGDGSMFFRLTPSVAGREPGSPAYRFLTGMEQVALDELGSADRLQHVVTLPDGHTVNGNLLMRVKRLPGQAADVLGPSTKEMAATPVVVDPEETITVTAGQADREVLRRAAFELLAGLETERADRGHPDRLRFADAAYCLFQSPEFRRGSDATMRALVAAAHTRIFETAPVVPHPIDLEAMVRSQQSFRDAMRDQL